MDEEQTSQEKDSTHPESIRYRAGAGNWAAFAQSKYTVDDVFLAAKNWKSKLAGIEKPWLCWSVDPDWCLVQQRLVQSVGWTPIVGFDPRTHIPPLETGSVLIDFNAEFGFPTMWFHFPIEFAFMFCDRLAFWHSDLLCRLDKMSALAQIFEGLVDNEIAAVKLRIGLQNRLNYKTHQFYELVGCTTRSASQDQFDKGCGWWVNFAHHPNTPSEHERKRRLKYHWESGVGIKYWSRKYGGRVKAIPEEFVSEGHFTRINNPDYINLSPDNFRRDLTKELRHNFQLATAARKLDIEEMLYEF